jgi:hypothetical protein
VLNAPDFTQVSLSLSDIDSAATPRPSAPHITQDDEEEKHHQQECIPDELVHAVEEEKHPPVVEPIKCPRCA